MEPPPEGVELLEAGTEPRRELRYVIAKETRSTIDLTLEVDVDAGGQGGPLPTLTLTNEIVAEEVFPNGAMRMRTTILDVRATERPGTMVPAETLTTNMQELRGTSVLGVLSPRGKLSEVTVDLMGKKLPPAIMSQLTNLSRSFEQVAMPLPGEPVGVGASWRNRRSVDQNGIKMMTLTTVTVTAIDATGFSFTSTSEVSGPDQKVTQPGGTIDMTAVGGNGTGKGRIELTKMTMTGETTAEFRSTMRGDDGQNAKMVMKMKTRVAPSTAPPTPPVPAENAGSATGSAASGSTATGSAATGSAAAGTDSGSSTP